MKLAEISIKRPSFVIVLFTILILGGLFSYTLLGYELIPKFDSNAVTITTVYPGASPAEFRVTRLSFVTGGRRNSTWHHALRHWIRCHRRDFALPVIYRPASSH